MRYTKNEHCIGKDEATARILFTFNANEHLDLEIFDEVEACCDIIWNVYAGNNDKGRSRVKLRVLKDRMEELCSQPLKELNDEQHMDPAGNA